MHFWRFWEAWGGGVFAVSATQAVCQAEQRPADGPTLSFACGVCPMLRVSTAASARSECQIQDSAGTLYLLVVL
jgi:hypothetical protein